MPFNFIVTTQNLIISCGEACKRKATQNEMGGGGAQMTPEQNEGPPRAKWVGHPQQNGAEATYNLRAS